MEYFTKRSILAIVIAVVLILILFITVSHSAYTFGLGITLAAFLAQLSTFKSGILHGLIAAIPLSLYLVLSNSVPGVDSSNPVSVLLNTILLIVFGAIYCGLVAWLINRLKAGKIFFS